MTVPKLCKCFYVSGSNSSLLHSQQHPNWFKETFSLLSSCLHRASMIIKQLIIQQMHNIKYVDTIKIIKYLKVLQHVSDHRGSIIREPCTVFD